MNGISPASILLILLDVYKRQVQGTTTGAVTDLDGKFTLEVPANATLVAVSYTHLDVYKRQQVNFLSHFLVQSATCQPITIVIHLPLGYVTSVSYTHLDVYKRQAHACGKGMG